VSAFSSLDLFYELDERRRRSAELDFGVWWRVGDDVYRVTWVDETGELIAVRLGRGRVDRTIKVATHASGIPGLFGFTVAGEPMEVYVLGRIRVRDQVEQLLAGWAEVCGEPESLGWVIDRLRTLEGAA
jgi:hypothetical protein